MTRHRTRWALPIAAALSMQVSACGDNPDTAATHSDIASSSPEANAPSAITQQAWTLLSDEPEDVPLEEGDYALTANGATQKRAVVRAPQGFSNYRGWTFVADEPFHAMGYVTADRVFQDPCGSTRHSKYATARDPGPTVADLAEALIAQKGAVTSTPAPVTIDGHAGLHLEYRISKGVDVTGCEDRAFDIFTTGPGGWYLEASREQADIWILDVDGDRVVLAWVAVPGVTRDQMNDMTAMVESARFVNSG